MSRRSNFNDRPDPAHREENFTRRLAETMDSELDPEQVTPNTAGAEELPEYEECFPLTRTFNQTNMHGRRGRRSTSTQRGEDQQ